MVGQSLLDVLSRFERQVHSSETTYENLVELFCLQIIPFLRDEKAINPLKQKWRRRYESLCNQITILEKAALEEVVGAFGRLKEDLKPIGGGLHKHIERIDGILAGNPGEAGFTSWPIYREVFFEIKHLLEFVLTKNGGKEICENYAVLGMKPKQERQLFRIKKPIKVKKEPYIMFYTFAPSIDKARLALDAAHWDRTNDPAVMWHYLVCAEWCWNTNESFFEKSLDILSRAANPFPALAEKGTWLEIAAVRDHLSMDHKPVIFTPGLFREGFQALHNDIAAFLAQDGQINDSPDPIDQVVLELHLNENRLWILASLGLGQIKPYYIKRFNDGKTDGSTPFAFLEELLKNYASGGEIPLDFADKSENVPKALERMGMLSFFKHLFFGQSRGNKVDFYGIKISLPRDEKCRLLLSEFERHHQEMGNPKYEFTDWSAAHSRSDSENS